MIPRPSHQPEVDSEAVITVNPVTDNSSVTNTTSTTLTSLEGDDNIPLSVKLAQLRAKRDEELKKRKEELSPKKQQPQKALLEPVQIKRESEDKQSSVLKKIKTTESVVVKTSELAVKEESSKVKVKATEEKEKVVIKKEVVKKVKNERDTKVATVVKKEKAVPVKKEKPTKNKKKEEVEEEAEEGNGEEEYSALKDNDGTVKWKTLEHSGPFFPPPYTPHGIPLIYDGQKIHLEPEAEEVAGFFAALIETDHGKNPTFQENFFSDFCQLLRDINPPHAKTIRHFAKCDFSLMFAHFQKLKEEKKSMTKEQKEAVKEEKKQVDEKYGWALLDGQREKVGNFRVEPPGLFRGRGKHPKTGKFKTRVQPEQVTINIGANTPVPVPPVGHHWGAVVHDNTVTWLATWTENINGNQKYVFLAPGSSLKAQSDLKKFETARKLKQHVDLIRSNYLKELKDKEMMVRQRATALWLIDRLALRAGNEKGEDEADTVGCCSLRCEHISLEEPDQVTFDFLGKDSIRYYNKLTVDLQVFKNLQIFMKPPKTAADPIFDRLTTTSLNKYLNSLMPGLTAKVFRTYNASHTFQQELQHTPFEGSVAEKILMYNRANRQVAILCNHQRAVPKTHDRTMERLKEKILTLKYQRHLVRKELLVNEGKKELQKLLPEALEPESEMDEATVKRKAEEEKEIERLKQEKKSSQSPSPSKDKKKRTFTTDTLVKKFTQLGERIQAAKHQVIDKDENKTTALGTSKTNYIDPRITVAWCAGHEVPVERMFNKSLREKFKWAMDVPKSWEF